MEVPGRTGGGGPSHGCPARTNRLQGPLPEALPGILNAVTITLVTLVSYSAMAGVVGGGGLGDLGIRYGYQRFDAVVMAAVVVILILLVQTIQFFGDRLVHRVNHRA